MKFRECLIRYSELSSKHHENKLTRRETWRAILAKKGFREKAGVYLYILKANAITYPLGRKSRIVYIGCSKNLPARLSWHSGREMKETLDGSSLAWFCQNYWKARKPFDILLASKPSKPRCHERQLERLFIGLFASKHGAPPICNGTVERGKFREELKDQTCDSIDEIKKLLARYET